MPEMVFIDMEDHNRVMGKTNLPEVLKVGQGIYINGTECRPVVKVEEKKVGSIKEIWVYVGKIPKDILYELGIGKDHLAPPIINN